MSDVITKPLNIVITGAGAGLGRELFEVLMADGHAVVGLDRKFGHNVTTPSKEWLEFTPNGVDVLINCAGINANDWFEDVTEDQMVNVMDVNAFAIVKMAQLYLDQLKTSRGTVINIVSNAATMAMTSSLAYNMSKAAALIATKQMAHELTKKYGITVFSVSPNKLEGTEMSKDIEANVQRVRGWTPEFSAQYQKASLMHGLETPPSQVAEFIANLLASGNFKYLSGCDIPFGK